MKLAIVKIKDAQPQGIYAPTSIDAKKDGADFLLVDMSFKNRIVWKDGRSEVVDNRKLKSLQKNHTWATDF